MESSGLEGKVLEMFEVGPCESAYQMGFLIGQRFSNLIRSRLARDLILQDQLLPFAQTPQAQPLLKALADNNKKKFPSYWDELIGTAEGSGVPVLNVIFHLESNKILSFYLSYYCISYFLVVHVQIILINFRKEIVPFLPKNKLISNAESPDDCSDVLIVSDSIAMVAHNEDANVALVGHTYGLLYSILF